MKFLSTSTTKDSFFTLPPEKQAAIMSATWTWADKHLKSGKCKEMYAFGNMKGAMSIWDLASSDEAARITLEFPMFAFAELQVTPLVEYDVAMKARKEMLEAAQKATRG